jgi:PAS domain S-box-containing protein
LAESQERFASFFDQAVDAMVVSSEDGIILEVNPAACSLLGWSREEMVGRGREMIIDVSDPRAAVAVGERSRDGLFHGELFSRRRNGERFEVEVTSKFYRARDGRRQAGTIVRDISARKQAEAVRLRSQRLESIGTLAGGIAHDLNNGLAPILLGITLLRRHFPERADLLNTLQSSASKAAAMVRQLLTFARGTEGDRRPVGSTRLLREVADLARSTFPRNITLSLDAPEDLWFVRGDETQLHQVALNLCVNARDAMPAGGTLTITACNEVRAERESSSLGDLQPGPYVVWSFRDTGTGMPAGVLERIFDPFYTTKPQGEGTGLGLPTALGIVRSHGGLFRVESREGAGSCFQVFLPASDAEAAPTGNATAAATAAPWSGRGRRILVVDDEPAVREVAVAVLESLGFGAESAIDAREALLRLADPAFAPVAVLTDFQMPGLDGLGLTREIRRRHPSLPVIVASGRFEESTLTGLRGLGVTELLPKPFEEARLVEALRRVLGEGASAVDSPSAMRLQHGKP